MSQLDELWKKRETGKHTQKELKTMVKLLSGEAANFKHSKFFKSQTEILAFIGKFELSPKKFAELLLQVKAPQEAIFRMGDKVKLGLKGKAPDWAKEMTKTKTKAEAMKFALNKDGEKFVEALYNPKPKAEPKKKKAKKD